ncbi:MAG: NUDIX domain-containing protein [Bacteroidota bacterium]
MKIFFDDRYIHLLKSGEQFDGQVLLPGSMDEIKQIIRPFEMDQSKHMMGVSATDYKLLKKDFKSLFTIVKAAGGLVRNEQGEVLFIHRKGRWDLPKGKINYELRITNRSPAMSGINSAELGEANYELQNSKRETRNAKRETRRTEAIREVKEETGLREVEVVRKLKPTYHVYHEKGKRMLKKTWWFEMMAPGDQPLTPQTEEEILYVRWFRLDELVVVLENTFGSLREMIMNTPQTP